MKEAVFTPKQKEALEGYCIILGDRIEPIGELSKITRENFKALWVADDDRLLELTVNEFSYSDPGAGDYDLIFTYDDYDYNVDRDSTPQKLLEILDAVAEEKITVES